MRNPITYQAFYYVFLFVLSTYLCALTHAKMYITARPERPSVGERCTVECELANADHLWLMIHKSLKNMSTLQQIKYQVTPQEKIDYGTEAWRSRREITVVKNPRRASISMTFTVRPTDRTKIQCLSTSPGFQQAFLELDVQRSPSVESLFTAHLNRTQRTDLMPGDIVLVVCDLRLGMPKSLEDTFVFTAPGEPVGEVKFGREDTDEYGYSNRSLELRRRVRVQDNDQLISCSASNIQGPAERTLPMNVVFAVKNVRLSAKHNGNVTAGEMITCFAEGNPPPRVTIAVLNSGRQKWAQKWAREGASGFREAQLKIPENANLSRYVITCTASNTVAGKAARLTTQASIRVVGPTLGNIGLYAGVVAALVLLIVIIAVIVVVRKRSSGEAKPERHAEPDRAASGRYDVEVTEKSGRGAQSYGTRVDAGRADGRNGGGLGAGDSDGEEGLGETTKLHYATLDLEDTPRSRMPIVFADDRHDRRNNDKVEYSEIVPSLSSAITTAFDEDHLYENVRHHDV